MNEGGITSYKEASFLQIWYQYLDVALVDGNGEDTDDEDKDPGADAEPHDHRGAAHLGLTVARDQIHESVSCGKVKINQGEIARLFCFAKIWL